MNNKISSRKELAVALSNNGKVSVNSVSKKLSRIVELWLSYGNIEIKNNSIIGKF